MKRIIDCLWFLFHKKEYLLVHDPYYSGGPPRPHWFVVGADADYASFIMLERSVLRLIEITIQEDQVFLMLNNKPSTLEEITKAFNKLSEKDRSRIIVKACAITRREIT